MFRNRLFSNSGNTLIMVMVASAVGLIVMMGLMSMFEYQIHNQKRLTQKFEAMNLENFLLMALSDPANCATQFSSTSISGSGSSFTASRVPTQISAAPGGQIIVQNGAPVSGSTTGLTVDTINISNILPAGANQYSASLSVSFASSSSGYLHPIYLSEIFQTNAAGNIIGCSVGPSSGATAGFACATGEYVTGWDSAGNPLCGPPVYQ